MPVQWTISHPTRLVVAVAKDEVRLEDIETYLDGVTLVGALPYRKIFDMSNTTPMLSDADMMALAARIRAYVELGEMGPLAIVAVSDESYERARMFETLAVADRPLKIFRELHLARKWLDSLPSAD
jgi:hypothetical protein